MIGVPGVPGMPVANGNGFFGAWPGMPGLQNMPFVPPIQAGTISWPPGANIADTDCTIEGQAPFKSSHLFDSHQLQEITLEGFC